jgi:hypothetical protein
MNRHRISMIVLGVLIPLAVWLAPANSEDKKPADSPNKKPANAEEKKPARPKADINILMKELMTMKIEDNQTFGLWMPFEVFVEMGIRPDGTNREAIEEGIDFLKKYQVIVVGMSLEEKDGTKTYATKQDLEERATLKWATGEEFPLAEKIPPRVAGVAEEFKREFATNQGEFGKNIHVLIFSTTAKDGKTLLSATKRNTLQLGFKESKEFKAVRLDWRTPFDSLTPVPPCTRCEETLSAKWSFCPWCGAKI